KIMKNPELKLPPLSEYLDYNEVDNIKRHLSYRLGNALIEANKNWYKGGYIIAVFRIMIISIKYSSSKIKKRFVK
ncbi:hypothetical protein OLT89_09120, partial [Campylobacter jejuni]|nr:hypothetical protein [Campylobacter jejuni]